MRAIEVQIQNVLGVRSLELQCDQNAVIVSGPNASGKSSTLDAICMALGGQSLVPADPVHHDATKGEVRVNVGTYSIQRTFTKGGGSRLMITAADGSKQRSPQALLNGLIGDLTFDPLEFGQAKASARLAQLKSLAGISLDDLDEERHRLELERKAKRATLKSLDGVLESQPYIEGLPDEPIDTNELTDEIEHVVRHNAGRAAIEAKLSQQTQVVSDARRRQGDATRQILALQKAVEELDAEIKGAESCVSECKAQLDAHKPLDVELAKRDLRDAEEINRRIQANKARRKLVQQKKDEALAYAKVHEDIATVDRQKTERLNNASMPIDGLSISDADVTYKGTPYEQLSTAEKTRVSFAICAKLAGDLKIAFVRGGNDLDQKNLASLCEQAAAAGVQVWIERIATNGAAVIMENGEGVVPSAWQWPI